MNARRFLILAIAGWPIVGAGGDPGIGLVLEYEATHPMRISELWLDGTLKVGVRGSWMYLNARSSKHEAWSTPRGSDAVPRQIRAVWRYEAIDPVDEAAQHTLPESQTPWRDADATVALREAVDAEALALLRNDTKRHRLRLVLSFDRDRLDVRWRIQRWR